MLSNAGPISADDADTLGASTVLVRLDRLCMRAAADQHFNVHWTAGGVTDGGMASRRRDGSSRSRSRGSLHLIGVDPCSQVVRLAISEKHRIAALSVPGALLDVPNNPLSPSWMQAEQLATESAAGIGDDGYMVAQTRLFVSLPRYCSPIVPVNPRDQRQRVCAAVLRSTLWAPVASREQPRRPDVLCGIPLGRVSAGRVVAEDEERVDWTHCILDVLV